MTHKAMQSGTAAVRGFTLAEMLVVLFLMSLLTLLTLNVTGPWLAFKAQGETEQSLQKIRSAIESYHEDNAFSIVLGAANTFGSFTNSTIASNSCNNQQTAFRALGSNIDTGATKVAMDAYKNNICVFVASGNKVVDGVRVYYRSIAFVSPGQDGVLATTSRLNTTTHQLTLAGDDQGFVFNGLASNIRKLQLTQERMARIAKMYELHFTSRYLASSSRDISKYYFSSWSDAGNVIGDSGINTWAASSSLLAPIGVGADLGQTAWDQNNNIEVNNRSGSIVVNGPTTLYVRSSAPEYATSGSLGLGAGFLPYTAMLRARVPSPNATPSYIVRSAVGGY